MKYKAVILISLIGFLFSDPAHSQVYERSRHETKAWKISKETSLEIYNKYGNIHLFTWDQDSVKIEVDMNIKASKEAKLEKIYEYIDFEFSENKYYVIARTRFNQQGEFWAEVTDLASTFFSSGTKVQIDYSVYLPSTINLKIENKFGNVYTTDHLGKMSVIISNGDFKSNDLKGNTDLNVSFGNAIINSIASGKLSLNYSELELGNTNNLVLDSKSSTINIEKAGTLTINSKRDKYYVSEVSTINGKSSFSYLTIKSFQSDLTLSSDYGDVSLEGLNPDFKLVELTSSYTDIVIKFPSKVSYTVDISHSSATVISAPESYSGLKSETVDKKTDLYRTKGTAGSGFLKKGKVSLHCKSGKITFREGL
jgi:hypothetical protein